MRFKRAIHSLLGPLALIYIASGLTSEAPHKDSTYSDSGEFPEIDIEAAVEKLTKDMQDTLSNKVKIRLPADQQAALDDIGVNLDHLLDRGDDSSDAGIGDAASSVQIDPNDPTSWPGHLKPFGSETGVSVEEAPGTLKPTTFVNRYVSKQKPVLLKGVIEKSPALKSWDITYLSNAPPSAMFNVSVFHLDTMERSLTNMRRFLKTDSADYFMMTDLPQFLQKDVAFPNCLKCDVLFDKMTTSTLMLYRGSISIEPFRVDIDRLVCPITSGSQHFIIPEHSWDTLAQNESSVSYQSVDFTTHPWIYKLKVFRTSELAIGDCLFVPKGWYIQSSYHKSPGMTLVFHWKVGVEKTTKSECGNHPSDDQHVGAYISKFKRMETQRDNAKDALIHYFIFYLGDNMASTFTLKQFLRKMKRDTKLFSRLVEWTPECAEIGEEIFSVLDVSGDGVFSERDAYVMDEPLRDGLVGQLSDRVQDLGSIMDEQQASFKPKSPPMAATNKKSAKKEAVSPTDDFSNKLREQMQKEMDDMLKDLEKEIEESEKNVKSGKSAESSKPNKSETPKTKEEIKEEAHRKSAEREKKKTAKEQRDAKRKSQERYVEVDEVEQEIVAEEDEDRPRKSGTGTSKEDKPSEKNPTSETDRISTENSSGRQPGKKAKEINKNAKSHKDEL